MTTIFTDYFNQAQLSLAAYADLSDLSNINIIIQALRDAGMSDTQARLFLGVDENGNEDEFKGYEIIDHLPNTNSGFSATIFRNKETGEITFETKGVGGT